MGKRGSGVYLNAVKRVASHCRLSIVDAGIVCVLHLPLEMRCPGRGGSAPMLSMAPDLVLNLIYGNAACSTYEQKERPEQPGRERERPGRRQKVRHTWVKLGEQQQQQEE